LLSLGLLAVLAAGPAWGGAALFGLGTGLLLALAGSTAARAYGDGRAGAVLGGCALPYAFAGGAVLVASGDGDRAGVFAPVPWIGGPELLAGSVALLLIAALGGVGVAASLRIFTAGLTVGLLGALTALAALLTSAAGAAAALLSVLVCGIGALPLLAIRLGKLPTPPVTLPTGSVAEQGFAGAPARDEGLDAVRERPDRGRVFAAVRRTEEVLTGLLIGHALLSVGAFAVLASSGGLAAQILMALAATALLLRSRLFVTLRHRLPLISAGLSGVFALGAELLRGAGDAMLLGLGLTGLLAALTTVAAGATWTRRAPSPYLGRTADLLDTLAVVAVIPVACSVLGLYGMASNLNI
jgi:type VII secretion integral membrane protein EccD